MATLNRSVVEYVLAMPRAQFPWPASASLLVRELNHMILELLSYDSSQIRSNPFDKYEFLFGASEAELPRRSADGSLAVGDKLKWGVLFTHYMYWRVQFIYLERTNLALALAHTLDSYQDNADLLEQALRAHYWGQDWSDILCASIRVELVIIDVAYRELQLGEDELLSILADFKICNEVAPGNDTFPFMALAIASCFEHRKVYQDWYNRLCRADSRHYELDFLKLSPYLADFEKWYKRWWR